MDTPTNAWLHVGFRLPHCDAQPRIHTPLVEEEAYSF